MARPAKDSKKVLGPQELWESVRRLVRMAEQFDLDFESLAITDDDRRDAGELTEILNGAMDRLEERLALRRNRAQIIYLRDSVASVYERVSSLRESAVRCLERLKDLYGEEAAPWARVFGWQMEKEDRFLHRLALDWTEIRGSRGPKEAASKKLAAAAGIAFRYFDALHRQEREAGVDRSPDADRYFDCLQEDFVRGSFAHRFFRLFGKSLPEVVRRSQSVRWLLEDGGIVLSAETLSHCKDELLDLPAISAGTPELIPDTVAWPPARKRGPSAGAEVVQR